MSHTIKAIETKYNGFLFRSRMEARWAVFFDQMQIKYFYEHEGFDLGEHGWYLPDFYFPESGWIVEVKGEGIEGIEKAQHFDDVCDEPYMGCIILTEPPDYPSRPDIADWNRTYYCLYRLTNLTHDEIINSEKVKEAVEKSKRYRF